MLIYDISEPLVIHQRNIDSICHLTHGVVIGCHFITLPHYVLITTVQNSSGLSILIDDVIKLLGVIFATAL